MASLPKFAFVLVREGIIPRDQMERILALQKKNPDILLGDIIVAEMAIAASTIDTAYADHVLAPFIRKCFMETLDRKLKHDHLSTDLLVKKINLTIASFRRHIDNITAFTRKNDKFTQNSSFAVLRKITGEIINFSIATKLGPEIPYPSFQFEIIMKTEQLNLENASLPADARVRLLQLYKKSTLPAS